MNATTTLGAIVEEHSGLIQTGPFGSQLHQRDYSESGIPVVMPTDIRDGQVDESDIARIPEGKAQELSRHILKAGSIVFPRRGEIGKCAYIGAEQAGFLCGTGCIKIEPPENILRSKFLYYYLGVRHVVEWLERNAVGTTMPNLNMEILGRLKIPVFPLHTQDLIASILSAYDDLIKNNHRRIRLLEQSARLLYKEWFVRFRFPGHESAKIKDGAPGGWQTCGMLEHPHFDFIRENIRQFDGEKRYYATADISGITITGNGINYPFQEKPSRAQKAPEINSVWFARMQDTYKVLVFTDTNRNLAEGSILSSGFAGFRARRPEFLPFLYLLINNEQFHEKKDLYCTGATQRSLPDNGLKNLRAPAPPPALLGKFADATGAMISQILTLQGANKKLAAARDLLLPRLMNNQLAV
ncbi:MAG: restriction endonuclease subunit S [Gammaproteobacteria bacterium]